MYTGSITGVSGFGMNPRRKNNEPVDRRRHSSEPRVNSPSKRRMRISDPFKKQKHPELPNIIGFPNSPIPNFWRMPGDRHQIFRSAVPDIANNRTINFLKANRIQVVLDARGTPSQEEAKRLEQSGITYQAIDTNNLPQSIPVIQDALQHNILVHCERGEDRTGTVIAVVHALQGWDFDRIVQEVGTLGTSRSNAFKAYILAQRFKKPQAS